MSKPQFKVQINCYEKINEIEGAWTPGDYLEILRELEFATDDNTSDDELRELGIMCLQDRTMVDAAAVVLTHRLKTRLSAGQIKNAAIEFADEKLWEHYADLTFHEELFHVCSLMFAAFPQECYEPEAIKLSVTIQSKNPVAAEVLKQPLQESTIVRWLADGMDERSIIHRLFDDQLKGSSFPEASSIVWIFDLTKTSDNELSGTIISSSHWLDSLKEVKEFESHAMPDTETTGR